MALFVLLNDTSQGDKSAPAYNLNRLHLDRALGYLEPREYARFRHTVGNPEPAVPGGKAASVKNEDFGMLVTKRVAEYIEQEESTSQRAFGEKLRHRLEELDQEVVRLKAPGLMNPLDYEAVFGVKLFALAESGSLSEFCACVEENDVRLFSRRKRHETIARLLPKSFQGIVRYGYFTPLLVAVQKKNHTIVSFIIESMKIPMR